MASIIARSRPTRRPVICEACLSHFAASHKPRPSLPRLFSSATATTNPTRRTPPERARRLYQSEIYATHNSAQRSSRTYSSSPHSHDLPQLGAGYTQLEHRRLVSLSGPDAVKFLQGLVTNNVDPNRQTPFYSAFLDARGRVLWDVFVWTSPSLVAREGNWACYIEVDGGETEALVNHLRRHKLRSKINIALPEEDEVSVWAAWSDPETMVDLGDTSLPDPRFLGSEMALRRFLVEGKRHDGNVEYFAGKDNFSERPSAEYHLLRYMYGIAEGPREIPRESALPMEYNIDLSQGIDFKKGCYVGQELTIRTKHTGVVRKRVLPVQLYDTDPLPSTAFRFPSVGSDQPAWDITESGAEIKQLDEQGSIKKGRAAGKLLTTMGNVGLALCRLEMMTSMKVSAEGGTWKPGMEFGIQNVETGQVKKVKPLVRDAFRTRERDIWDKNRSRI